MFAKSHIVDPSARLMINPYASIRSTLDRDEDANFVHRLMKLRRELRRQNLKQVGKSKRT